MTIGDWTQKDALECWQHEDQLVNHRLQWFGVIQGLLFTAYGLSFRIDPTQHPNSEKLTHFLTIVPWAGFATCIVVLIGVVAAFSAMQVIKVQSKVSKLGIHPVTRAMGMVAAVCLPIVLGTAWLLMIIL